MITAKGYVTMDELDLEVFAPHGFRLVGETDTIPLLDFIQKPTCEEVFDEWLKIALANDQYRVPPKIIPPSLAKKYLMNGHAHLIEEYRSDRPEGQEHVWSQIPKWLEMPVDELYKISLYGKSGSLFFLGLPRGSDTVVFNLHRIYGPLRLAMVMTGYELVATFRDDSPVPASLDRSHFDLGRGQFVQDLFVLRKL
uniref:Uncharacterized protein n=1 Tax=Haemonchus contortus TaxID=6289 RepID=W6NHF2_HAECO